MKYVDSDNYSLFDKRYAACPLCLRDNVLLRYYAGSVSFDEHPMLQIVATHLAPVDRGGRLNLHTTDATYAHVRCPLSNAPLVVKEDT